DPSYAGQIVVMTAPHIGNTGMNDDDMESQRLWVAGFVVRDPARRVSNYRATRSLDDDLVAGGIVGIQGVDTRALTRHIRAAGAMRAGIFSGEHRASAPQQQLEEVRSSSPMAGRNLSEVVSTARRYTLPAAAPRVGRVAVLDLGVKRSSLEQLRARGFDVDVFPAAATAEEVLAAHPDAVFYSNGPGDPAASESQVALLRAVLTARVPYFGICFGNQLLGRALGLATYKLPFGHRGINQPVLDKATGRVEITAQNHGFAVEAPTDQVIDSPAGLGRVVVSHVSLNDQVVEGLRCLDLRAFSVQYHPEAAAGPHDAAHLFDRFRDFVLAGGQARDQTADGQEGSL
ncbi:MAG TPA: glutamine-hydrolyzing carbamoyl-phosphate synthase small subunit, partial [Microbacteriaceae bacterium]|nr:glutamine-hydrolyzing carbamoyl-phosphate synthase small subunit [Microbacteriaceae bacterium]